MSGPGAPAAPSKDAWIAGVEKGQGAPLPKKKKKQPKGGSSGLRRAFSWLRGKRKKAAAAEGKEEEEEEDGHPHHPHQQPGAPAAAEGGKKPQARPKGKGAAKAEKEKCLSVQYKTAGDERASNAFFSSSRPPHLEVLHSEAQAGLKSLQNQEKQKYTKRTWDHSDTSSLQSSRTSTEGDDVSIRSQTLSCTTETTSEDALSIRSEMIQRKGSTFRPHDSFPKSLAKGQKRRRERRTTVLGLPTHVQKELGLSNGYDTKKCPGSFSVRSSPTPQLLVNGAKGCGNAIHIPTIDGKMEPDAVPEGGARVSLLEVEAAADNSLQGHIDRVYYDDSLLGRRTAGKLSSPLARPKSLAVPWLTTRPASPPESLGPVMSISPQGTYLSKIIPNAVLPPLVDVIALSCNRVRTLSRCSLSTASPSPSVRSVGRFPAPARSREHSSSSDNWSHSQSTETIVSNTSTISSQGGGSRKGGMGPDGRGLVAPGPDPDGLSTYSSRSGASTTWAPAKAAPASPNLLGVSGGGSSGRASPAYSTGSAADGSDGMSVRSDRSSARSVSLRKMKKAPAPPRRTYSLHQKAQQLEAEGAPKGMGLPPKPSRRPPREGSEAWGPQGPNQRPSLAGEDDVFSPSSPSKAGSLACSQDMAHRGPVTAAKLQEGEGRVAPETPEVSSKHSSPDHFGRTMSPSSGYSSQSGTPTLQAKSPAAHIASPGKKGPQPKKPERVCSLHSPGLSVSSSLTSLSSSASDPAPLEGAAVSPAGASSSPSPSAGPLPAPPHKMDRFVIPPHPKVPAPSCPPPTKTQPPEPGRDEATISAPNFRGEGLPGTPTKPSQGPSPPPSPPPAYHPPPPPAKKSEGDPEPPTVPLPALPEAEAVLDSMWPPPPPPVPDAHDLSMADFPPPDEAFFLPGLGAPPVATAASEGTPLPVEELPANQKDTPAGEDKAAPVPSPSFSTVVSYKSQPDGPPDATLLPPPKIEPPPPPPPPSAPVGNPSDSAPIAHRQAHESVPASPSSPRAPPNLKKVAPGPRKEPLPAPGRSKSSPMPKEDASLPIVTPSLLQMVRLRSVHLDAHGPAAGPSAPAEPNGPAPGAAEGKPGQAATPQKPIRKSLSLRVPNVAGKDAGPSNPLHEAVRLKASTLSSREAGGGLGVAAERNARKRMTLPAFSAAAPSSAAGEARDSQVSPLLKSPASTASFIFARSPKKLVIETPSSPEAQANLKKNLVVELMNVSGQRSLAGPAPAPQGSGKPLAQKVPPPIAKKPSLGSVSLQSPHSPQPPGGREPTAPLPAAGDRTTNKGSAGPAARVGVRNNSSAAAVPEMPLQSPPAQDFREEMA
ncbi:hypothetical protein JRQ81_011992 [Phrynocephalus forsythii]|uniref:KIAA1522 n=1 Tax=Phrynocephalus forsythii TaxID=171643 RepID=A0A9Q0X8T4_9SAUR|nr:hypothetical protein JRQ81_011992 [Phrynocephalus forsythii]